MAKKVPARRKLPFSLEDRMGCTTSPIIAIENTFEAVRVVFRTIYPEPQVKDHTILLAHIADSREASIEERSIYYVPPASENPIPTHLAFLRRLAVEQGATPEAIRLLGQLTPWTKKEEAIMAEKLKSKASAAKPDKEALKSAANSAPVGGNKRRGNAEGLAKARAARTSGPDTRKVKPLVKVKDLTAREGTFRREMLEDLLASKTVQEFRDKDTKYDASCVRFAVETGIVSLS